MATRPPPALETPPRAWGRPRRHGNDRQGYRNTPTSVGKTPGHCSRKRAGRKHPHERGEDRRSGAGTARYSETPPRAWGRPARPCPTARNCGNTPTSVGKTMSMNWPGAMRRKHPHERGEDRGMAPGRERGRETPPRAWGRLGQNGAGKSRDRNTPTSVGKTGRGALRCDPRRKHPHERGEDQGVSVLRARR